jgi:hypothetical protein
MSEKRRLKFDSIDEVIAEIARLRPGYRQLRNWNLPMMGRHITLTIERFLMPPANSVPTPDEAARKAAFVDVVLATFRPPPGLIPPPDLMPPPDCTEADIDRAISALEKLKSYPHPLVAMGAMGPVSIDEFRRLNLIHIAHHLGYLIPT